MAPPSLQLDFIEPDHCEALQRHYIAAAEGKATKGFLMYETHRLGFSTSAIIVLAIDPWLDFTTPAKLHDINMVSTCFNMFQQFCPGIPCGSMGYHGDSWKFVGSSCPPQEGVASLFGLFLIQLAIRNMYLGQKPSTTSGFYQQQWRSNQQNS